MNDDEQKWRDAGCPEMPRYTGVCHAGARHEAAADRGCWGWLCIACWRWCLDLIRRLRGEKS